MRSTICLKRPHLHLAEALPAELGFTTQRLLCYERVRTRRAGVNLIVHQMQELHYVHIAHSDFAVERFAGPPVIERDLAAGAHTNTVILAHRLDSFVDIFNLGTREDRGRDEDRFPTILTEAAACGPSQVGLENLADIHSARDAQRTQDHIHWSPILHERHVLLRHDLGDDTLVAMPASKLVALGDLALLRYEDSHHLVHTRLQLIT